MTTPPSDPTAYLVEIAANLNGTGSIKVGGQDLSELAVGFTISSHVNDVTRLQLDLRPVVARVQAGALVSLDEETHALLVHLGWTPPPDVPVEPGGTGSGVRYPP